MLFKSTRFAASTIKDTEQRLKSWIALSAIHPRTNKIIFNNRKDLNIGAKKVIEITKDDLIAWHAEVSITGDHHGNRCVDDLKLIFKWALEQKIIKENIFKFTKNELNKEYTRLDDKDPYSREEWRLLRKAALKLIKKNPQIKISCMSINFSYVYW